MLAILKTRKCGPGPQGKRTCHRRGAGLNPGQRARLLFLCQRALEFRREQGLLGANETVSRCRRLIDHELDTWAKSSGPLSSALDLIDRGLRNEVRAEFGTDIPLDFEIPGDLGKGAAADAGILLAEQRRTALFAKAAAELVKLAWKKPLTSIWGSSPFADWPKDQLKSGILRLTELDPAALEVRFVAEHDRLHGATRANIARSVGAALKRQIAEIIYRAHDSLFGSELDRRLEEVLQRLSLLASYEGTAERARA